MPTAKSHRLSCAASVLRLAIFNEPNGININNGCGSLIWRLCRRKVVEVGAHREYVADGDADRCLVVDENGRGYGRRQIMLICALELTSATRKRRMTILW